MSTFDDLVVYQRAKELMVAIYDATKSFPKDELYGLTSQLRRAAVGVVAQIAEGKGRITWGELRQFLSQARGSLFEIEAECTAAVLLGYLSEEQERSLKRHLGGTAAALNGYINWVRSQGARPGARVPRRPANAPP